MKASYQSPTAALLPAETADILTFSTQAQADLGSDGFDAIHATQLF